MKGHTMTGDFEGDTPDQQVTHSMEEHEMTETSTTLRTRIANVIAAYDEGEGAGYPMQRYEEGANIILDAIRDALLSDAPVTAATRITEPTEYPWPSARARSAILAALDAVTNGGDA